MMHTWEGIPDLWSWASTGDNMASSDTTADALRKRIIVYSHCLDGSHGDTHFAHDLDVIQQCNADIILLQDPRWSAPQADSTITLLQRVWSVPGMWHRHWSGIQPLSKRHGIFVAVRAPWCDRILGEVHDDRKWARFGGVIIQGNSGSVAVISVYAPTFSPDGADVVWQKAQISNLGISISSWKLFREDLAIVVHRLQTAGTVCVIAGDTNTT